MQNFSNVSVLDSLTQKSCDLTYVGYYAGYSVQVLCSLRNRVFSYLITG